MKFWLIGHQVEYAIRHVIMLFFPGEKLEAELDIPNEATIEEGIFTELCKTSEVLSFRVAIKTNGVFLEKIMTVDYQEETLKKITEETFGKLLYQLLSETTYISPPWGTLIGVRPIKFIEVGKSKGKTDEEISNDLENNFFVSPDKVNLLFRTYRGQERALSTLKKGINLYVGIPFCPKRCKYCSFVSHDTASTRHLIPEYLAKLCEEIQYIANFINTFSLPLHTIYIGGGTPTTLEVEQLSVLLDTINTSFNLTDVIEYTVEAGRADTITMEKLQVIRNYGVDRVSINPQSMQSSVLEAVGRSHSPEQVIEAFHMAREVGFPIINMDLIAGLESDTFDGFMDSLDQVLKLDPENITIHTLSMKRASEMVEKGKGIYDAKSGFVENILESAYPKLYTKNYEPYYLYRQKNMRENLENVGFAKAGTENRYNIVMMEELESIIACGAGSVSKVVNREVSQIERFFNYKTPHEYIRNFDEILKRKDASFLALENCKNV